MKAQKIILNIYVLNGQHGAATLKYMSGYIAWGKCVVVLYNTNLGLILVSMSPKVILKSNILKPWERLLTDVAKPPKMDDLVLPCMLTSVNALFTVIFFGRQNQILVLVFMCELKSPFIHLYKCLRPTQISVSKS